MNEIKLLATNPKNLWYVIYRLYPVDSSSSTASYLLRLAHIATSNSYYSRTLLELSDEIWANVEENHSYASFEDTQEELKNQYEAQFDQLPFFIELNQISGQLSFLGICDQQGVPFSQSNPLNLKSDVFLGVGLTRVEEESVLAYQVVLLPLRPSEEAFKYIQQFLSGFLSRKIDRYEGTRMKLLVDSQTVVCQDQEAPYASAFQGIDPNFPSSMRDPAHVSNRISVFPLEVSGRASHHSVGQQLPPYWGELQQILRKLYFNSKR